MYVILLKSIIIGFVTSAPVGPIGLLCISRAFYGGVAYGVWSWLGVATANALAGGIVALGFTLIPGFPVSLQPWLRFIGGTFLCYLGLKIFMARPTGRAAAARASGPLGGFISTFFLTATNPVTFPSFFAIYAGWGVEGLRGEYFSAAVLAVGIFIGTALWCLVLGVGLLVCRDRFSDAVLRWLQRVSGAVIAGFGFVVLIWR
jgi:threonine/homoserine/homoserine lactone efflux protein